MIKSNVEMNYQNTLQRIKDTQGQDEELLTYFQSQFLKKLFTKTVTVEDDSNKFESKDTLEPR